ncbi:Methyltransferase type 11 [Kribbella flavida DSM 17836]|uniref:Methyltransferase type 11 n=1 Tax=Kribbella flavida (strain DSM 17836 / JCM 10339 / NBRC 14399) TaxID=479435 RepID=D2Q2V8_KRIFD|nr:class I SAM-dependent methyltransferase [Kribbella flavida]ADB30289.1 Methyltransferase type 11 [Kribbella flavida DSM 17836]
MTPLDPLIRSFYRDRYVEHDRLARSGHGQLEFLRTQELIRRYLPPAPARVLDVGGATGVHARWLAADGYEVELVDPLEEHVAVAAAAGGFTASLGDARELAQADNSVGATLLLGPLYHLVDRADRLQALREAGRVTRRGGLVVAVGISRYAGLLECGNNGQLSEDNLGSFVDVLATGLHHDDPNGFTTAYFHHADELGAELDDAGLNEVFVLGVEGPAAHTLENAAPSDVPRLMPAAITLARLVESDPAMIATSLHYLAIGRVG